MPGARDGQLRVRRGTDSPPWALQMFDDDLGLWLTLCQADVEEDAMRAGIPILRGPYVVDFSDIPHDGDTLTLWTPAVGDVLLRMFPDWQTITQWDHGSLFIGQNVDGTVTPAHNAFCFSSGSNIDRLDMGWQVTQFDGSGTTHDATYYVFHSTDPVQIQVARTSGTDPTQGHVELYALVARAVAP